MLADAATLILEAIGENPDREGLHDTPRRFAAMWHEFIDYEPGNMDATFESISADQLVVVSGMRVWSLCEHHLLPFRCDLTVGYLTSERVLGLSKFGRIAHQQAHRLQLQERLVRDVATAVAVLANTEDVAVLGHGEHLCMTMRGIRTPAVMTTSDVRGRFRDEVALRAEFMSLATTKVATAK